MWQYPAQNDGQALRQAIQDSLTWIGHASFLVQLGGRSILIYAVLSESLGPWFPRNMPPGLRGADLPSIDAVLITHNHRDHMDESTLRQLGPSPLYMVPKGLGSWFERRGLKRVQEISWWDEQDVAGVKITFVPSQHWSRRGLLDANQSRWGGYVLEHDGLRYYHSGDTGWFDGFRSIGERVGDIQALGAEQFVAMHWGTFKLTDEPLDEPSEFLRAVWEKNQLAYQRMRIPAVGETLIYR